MNIYSIIFIFLCFLSSLSFADSDNSEYLELSISSTKLSNEEHVPDEFQSSSSIQFYGRSDTKQFFSTPFTYELEGKIDHQFNNYQTNNPYSLLFNFYLPLKYVDDNKCGEKSRSAVIDGNDSDTDDDSCIKYSPLNPPFINFLLSGLHAEYEFNDTSPLNNKDYDEISIIPALRFHHWLDGFSNTDGSLESISYSDISADFGFKFTNSSDNDFDGKSAFAHVTYRLSFPEVDIQLLRGELELNAFYEYSDLDESEDTDILLFEAIYRNKFYKKNWFIETSLAHKEEDNGSQDQSTNVFTIKGVYYFGDMIIVSHGFGGSRYYVNGRIRNY